MAKLKFDEAQIATLQSQDLFNPSKAGVDAAAVHPHMQAKTGMWGTTPKGAATILSDVGAHVREVGGEMQVANTSLQSALGQIEHHSRIKGLGLEVGGLTTAELKSHARTAYDEIAKGKRVISEQLRHYSGAQAEVLEKLRAFHDFHFEEIGKAVRGAATLAPTANVVVNDKTYDFLKGLGITPTGGSATYTKQQLEEAVVKVGEHHAARAEAVVKVFDGHTTGMKDALRFIEEKATKVKEITGVEIPEKVLNAGKANVAKAGAAGIQSAEKGLAQTAEKGMLDVFRKGGVAGARVSMGRVAVGAAAALALGYVGKKLLFPDRDQEQGMAR